MSESRDTTSRRTTSTDSKTGQDPKRSRFRLVAWIVGALGLIVPVVALVAIVGFLIAYATVTVPRPGDIKQNQVATIVDTKGNTLAKIVPPEGNRTDVSINDIPKSMQDAVIAAEDREFRTNDGFSIRGLSRAVWGRITDNDLAGGGSTITQQYVKNALVGDEHSYERKLRELVIATKMSSEWSKDDIMVKVFPSGRKEVFRVRMASGRVVEATGNHPFMSACRSIITTR